MQKEAIQQETDVVEIDFARFFRNIARIIKKLWLCMILMIALSAAAVVFIQQNTYTPSYKAHSTFFVHVINKGTLSDTNSLYAVYYDQDLAEQLDATFSYLVNSDFLVDDIREYLDGRTVDGSIHANSIKGSNIFVLSATGSTPEKAALLLEALMAVYYDAARYVVGDMTTEIIEEPVVSQTPQNAPNLVLSAAIGIGIGLVLCAGVIFLYSMLKRTVFDPKDLEKYLNMPCFGIVPILRAKRSLNDSLSKTSTTQEQGAFRESIRGVARKLENAVSRGDVRVILVTSTVAGEGKSMLSQQLAERFVHWGKSVALLDGDLRRPTLYSRYGLREEMSLEAVLSGKAAPETVFVRPWEDKLTLALNTMPVKDPTVAIDSTAMKNLIESLSAQADLVIIDTPPCGQLSDVSLYQQYADGILYVVQQDQAPIRQIVDAAENLCESQNKLLGYVINGAQKVPQGYGKYGYGSYSYGKYGRGKYGYSKYGYYGGYDDSETSPAVSQR